MFLTKCSPEHRRKTSRKDYSLSKGIIVKTDLFSRGGVKCLRD